jgi:hypothetical protein
MADQQPIFCLPDGVTNGQLAKVVIKYLDDHPEDLHSTADSLCGVCVDESVPVSR